MDGRGTEDRSVPAAGGVPGREACLDCLAALSTALLRSRDPQTCFGTAVERLRAASAADRCFLFENRLDRAGLRTTLRAESCAPGVEPALGRPETIDAPLCVLDRPELARGEAFLGPPEAWPPEARTLLEREALRWLALLPVRVDGSWWGTLGFASHREGVRFADADVALLRIAAEAIGVALERARCEALSSEGEERFPGGCGEPRAMLVARDATEQQRRDEERARLEQAMDQAGDAIVIWDCTGRGVFVNAAWERQMGIDRRASLGRSIREFAELSMTTDHIAEMSETLCGQSSWKGRLRGRQGQLVDTSIAAVRDGSGAIRHFISVTRDVTREVELESRLRQQQKLEAIGTLATGIAHDFNNLLTGVLGYAELLEKDDLDPDARREAIEVIGQAARRGAELTAQLLRSTTRSRRASGSVDVHEVVKEVVALTARTFPRSIEVCAQLDAERSRVEGDAGQLQQVLLNLVLNARDAMEPAGGVLRIATVVLPGTRPQLALRVSDTGPGIDPALRERIFEPFFTTKPREKGTGLGLAVAYGIVQSHGGSIRVDAAPGGGARFEVCLPLSAAPAPPAPDARAPLVAGTGRVLVVDDEPSVRRVAARMLQRLGYETDEAAHGHEAVQLVRCGAEHFDLVLLDLDMPGLDGRTCVLALHDLAPGLPLLLSTGLPTGELDAALLDAVAGMLPKPYELAELGRAVAEALGRRR